MKFSNLIIFVSITLLPSTGRSEPSSYFIEEAYTQSLIIDALSGFYREFVRINEEKREGKNDVIFVLGKPEHFPGEGVLIVTQNQITRWYKVSPTSGGIDIKRTQPAMSDAEISNLMMKLKKARDSEANKRKNEKHDGSISWFDYFDIYIAEDGESSQFQISEFQAAEFIDNLELFITGDS